MFKEGDKVRLLGFIKDENGNDFAEPEWNKFIGEVGIISSTDYDFSPIYPITLFFYDERGIFIDCFDVMESEIELIEEV